MARYEDHEQIDIWSFDIDHVNVSNRTLKKNLSRVVELIGIVS